MSYRDDDGFVKGRPYIRTWELNENSTRYDIVAAAPSDEILQKYWWSWSAITLSVGSFSLIVCLSILSSRKARQNSFNLYIVYLMIPDFIFSLLCFMTCFMNAINGEYWSGWMCNFQQGYAVFGIGANTWLNAVVTYQLHTMLRYSYRRRRYRSPSRATVSIHAAIVYLFCFFLGSWGVYDKQMFPYHSGTYSGLACLPLEVDRASTMFFWFIFFPLFAGIPILYVGYACYDVWRNTLLPPTGKRRLLAVYFARLIIVFLVMWIPTVVVLFVVPVGPWLSFAGGSWSHLQGFVSAVVSLMKPDIAASFKNLITCNWCKEDIDSRPSMAGKSSIFKSIRESFAFQGLSRSSFVQSSTAIVSGEFAKNESDFEECLEERRGRRPSKRGSWKPESSIGGSSGPLWPAESSCDFSVGEYTNEPLGNMAQLDGDGPIVFLPSEDLESSGKTENVTSTVSKENDTNIAERTPSVSDGDENLAADPGSDDLQLIERESEDAGGNL